MARALIVFKQKIDAVHDYLFPDEHSISVHHSVTSTNTLFYIRLFSLIYLLGISHLEHNDYAFRPQQHNLSDHAGLFSHVAVLPAVHSGLYDQWVWEMGPSVSPVQ